MKEIDEAERYVQGVLDYKEDFKGVHEPSLKTALAALRTIRDIELLPKQDMWKVWTIVDKFNSYLSGCE